VKGPKRHVDDILSRYVDILNTDGPESPKELSFLKEHGGDSETVKLLRGARAVKALFESFGDFPDFGSRRNGRGKAIKTTTK